MGVNALLPIGTLQLLATIDHGYWYARSAEFMQQPMPTSRAALHISPLTTTKPLDLGPCFIRQHIPLEHSDRLHLPLLRCL